MSKLLTHTIFTSFALLNWTLLLAEIYRYEPIIEQISPFNLSTFVFFNLSILFFFSLYKLIYHHPKYSHLFLFLVGTTWVLFQVLIQLDELMVSATDNNTEILYLLHHLDIRPVLQTQQTFLLFFKTSFIFFLPTIFQTTIYFINLLISFGSFLLKVTHQKKFTQSFQFWQEALFISSLIIFYSQQIIFPVFAHHIYLYPILIYSEVGAIIHSPKLNITTISSLIILTITHHLRTISHLEIKTAFIILASTICLYLVYALYKMPPKPNETTHT